MIRSVATAVCLSAFALKPLAAQGRADPAVLMASQRTAMAGLSWMEGVWRGPAWTILPSGVKHSVMQTERIGPFLDGTVKVIEGRGYDEATGSVSLNALGIVSYNVGSQAFTLHSYALGQAERIGNTDWPAAGAISRK